MACLLSVASKKPNEHNVCSTWVNLCTRVFNVFAKFAGDKFIFANEMDSEIHNDQEYIYLPRVLEGPSGCWQRFDKISSPSAFIGGYRN